MVTKANLLAPSQTGDYRPSVIGMYAPWLMGRGGFSFFDIELMRDDPRVRLGLRVLKAPLAVVKWTVESQDQNVSAWVDKTLKTLWRSELPRFLLMYDYGRSGGECNWKLDTETDLVEVDYIRHIYAHDMQPMELNGRFWGVRVMGRDIPVGRCFYLVNEAELHPYYGRSALRGAWEPWKEKSDPRRGAKAVRTLWYVKNAYRGGQMRHPMGLMDKGDGTMVSCQDFARELCEKAEVGGIMTLPNFFNEANGKYLWEYEDPTINGEISGVREYVKDLDGEIFEGMEIPVEVVTAVESGSWAGRSVPFLVYLTGRDASADYVISTLDKQIIRPGAEANFGKQVKYTIVIESLVPKDQQAEGGASPTAAGSIGAGPEEAGAAGIPYEGPRGGHGLKDPTTGRVSYGDLLGLERLGFDPNEPRGQPGNAGQWVAGGSGSVIGKGSTGDVVKVGDQVRKKATGNEGKVYAALVGVEGVAPGKEEDGEIVTPHYPHVVSVDTILDKQRHNLAPVVKKALPQLVNAITALSEAGYNYNDPLQVGFDKGRNGHLFDFSAAEKDGNAARENLAHLSNYLNQFGLERHGKAISQVSGLLDYVNSPETREFDSESDEAKEAEKVVSQLDGKPAKYAYYSFNAREIPGVAQTDNRNGVKVVFSDKPLSQEMMSQWELNPAVHRHPDAVRLALEDWQPHQMQQGPHKGQQGWKNIKTGEVRPDRPTEREAGAEQKTASPQLKQQLDQAGAQALQDPAHPMNARKAEMRPVKFGEHQLKTIVGTPEKPLSAAEHGQMAKAHAHVASIMKANGHDASGQEMAARWHQGKAGHGQQGQQTQQEPTQQQSQPAPPPAQSPAAQTPAAEPTQLQQAALQPPTQPATPPVQTPSPTAQPAAQSSSLDTTVDIRSAPPPHLAANGAAAIRRMTPEETSTVSDYSNMGYKDLNESMRSCPPDFKCLDAGTRKYMDTVEAAIAKAQPFAEPVKVYRGLAVDKGTADALFQAAAEHAQSGADFTLPSITSTSTSPQMVTDIFKGQFNKHATPVVFQIKAKRGLYVESISQNQGEHEVLQSHKTRYRVLGVGDVNFQGGDSPVQHRVIHLEEI